MRGLGKQGMASVISIIGYWILGIPLSLIAVFSLDLGIAGLWIGPTVAIVFNFTFITLFIMKTNWGRVAKEARKRFEDEAKIREVTE